MSVQDLGASSDFRRPFIGTVSLPLKKVKIKGFYHIIHLHLDSLSYSDTTKVRKYFEDIIAKSVML